MNYYIWLDSDCRLGYISDATLPDRHTLYTIVT